MQDLKKMPDFSKNHQKIIKKYLHISMTPGAGHSYLHQSNMGVHLFSGLFMQVYDAEYDRMDSKMCILGVRTCIWMSGLVF